MKRYCHLDSAFATVSAITDDGIFLVLDNGEEAVCHTFSWLPQGAHVLVTVLSLGREQGRFRRVGIESIESVDAYELSESDWMEFRQCAEKTVA